MKEKREEKKKKKTQVGLVGSSGAREGYGKRLDHGKLVGFDEIVAVLAYKYNPGRRDHHCSKTTYGGIDDIYRGREWQCS